MRQILFIKILFIQIVLLISGEAGAKNFYLTVRRDYAPSESPEIELIYNSQIPVRLRLLRPKNMDGFIKEQIDLRRAWKEPQSQVNSARFFLMGLNRTRLDVDWIRYHFNEFIRSGLTPQLGGAEFAKSGTALSEGPSRMIRAPANFEVITEFSLAEEEDKDKPFDVPGFNWYFGNSGSYKTRLIHLPAQKSGFYVVQALQGSDEGQVVLVVNDIKAMLQQTDGLAVIRATDRTGAPLRDAKVRLRNLKGNWIQEGQTDANGVCELKTDANTELVAVIESGEGTALIDTEFLSTNAEFPDVFLYSDRPMYKPEGHVKFKGIARRRQDRSSNLLNINGAVSTALYASGGSLIAEGSTAQPTEFGSFSGEIPLAGARSSGIYRLQSSVNGIAHVGEIRVKEYVKPLYFLTVSSNLDSVRPGQNLPLTLAAERYAGGVPPSVVARVEILRVRYDGPEWIEDAGLGEKGSETTYGFRGDEKIPIIPISVHVVEDIRLPSSGKKTVSIPLPKDLPGDPGYDYKIVVKVSATDADENFASVSKSFLEATSEFMVQSRSSAVYVEKSQSAWLEARALTPGGNPYGKISGSVRFFVSGYGQEPVGHASQDLQSDPSGKFKIAFPTAQSGVVTATLTLRSASGAIESVSEEILVAEPGSPAPVKKVSDLTILSRRSVYSEGETAKALVLLPEGWGVGGSNSGYVYTTVAGRTIYRKNAEKIQGQTYWINLELTPDLGSTVYLIIAYSDPKQGFVERRMEYSIRPDDKILRVVLQPADPVLEPGREQSLELQVQDHAGRPVQSEVSVSVVDRAVLDLQPEFRPRLLEFFYPKDRLNLMSFFSNEFQSYGYAETIARLFKPNYGFTATKPAEEPQKEEDTAYWNPAVRTDAAGKATVRFRLPVNQTIWKVSAVAIDQQGRFGEGQSEFKAQTEVPITLAMPAAIRKGETFDLRVALENLSRSTAHTVRLRLKPSGALNSKTPPEPVQIELKPDESFILRQELGPELNEPLALASVQVQAEVDGSARHFEQEIKLLDGYNRTPMQEEFNPDGQLELNLADHETVNDPKIRILGGFSGAVIPAMHWMTQYPYGCIEQVINTTIPNLAIVDIFAPEMNAAIEISMWSRLLAFTRSMWRWMGAFVTGTKPVVMTDQQKRILQEAVHNAKAGIAKVHQLQIREGSDSGSFQWFDGVPSDYRMHYYVMTSLVGVERTELLNGIDLSAAFKALERFKYSSPGDSTTKNVLNRYIQSQLYRLKLWDEPVGAADLRFSLEASLKEGNPILLAYSLRTAQDSKPEDAQTVSDLRPAVRQALVKILDEILKERSPIQPAVLNDWQDFIGRRGSTTALVARALRGESGGLDKDRTERIRQALLAQFNGESFGSTYETGQILLHSTWLIREEIENRRIGRSPAVYVNDKQIASEARLILAGWEIPVELESTSKQKIRFSVRKEEASDRIHLIGRRAVPMNFARPVAGRYHLDRKVYKLNETTQELSELNDNEPVQVGDLLYIENFVQAGPQSNPFASSYYVLANDLPSGTSLVENDDRFSSLAVHAETSGWVKREESGGRLNYYFDFKRGWNDVLREGRKIGYIVRVNFAGEFHTGVSRFMDFYDEDSFSQSGSTALRVQPAGAR